MAEQIETARIEETSHPVLQNWFDDYRRAQYPAPQHGRNRLSIGSIKATRVTVDRTQNIR